MLPSDAEANDDSGLDGGRSPVSDLILRWPVSDDLGGLLTTLCDALAVAGLPLTRMSINMPAMHPTLRAFGYVWLREAPKAADATEYTDDTEVDRNYQRGPIAYLEEQQRDGNRWRLEQGEGCHDVPFLAEMQARGGTDYVIRLLPFTGPMSSGLRGVAVSMATDRPGGFSDHDVTAFDAILPALAIACHRYIVVRTSADLLGIYLGPMTAQHVLAGEVKRGMGRKIPAAILVADLQGFTALADWEDPMRLVGWLDQHLEAVGAPIWHHGGEVLKFLGDGLLAVFPTEGPEVTDADACARALAAAVQALARTAELNGARRSRGEPVLELDIVLHHGEVIYGNVGAARRLDFTVIGRAVNEVCRMEELCGRLGHPLLLSAPFAARCGQRTTSLGYYPLRGIRGELEVLIVAE